MREVVPVRLSGAERAQIAGAAGRRKLTLSGFIRQASLQASAVADGKATPKVQATDRKIAERGPPPLVVVEPELPEHGVDGVRVGRSELAGVGA